jgi:hypothetical protein
LEKYSVPANIPFRWTGIIVHNKKVTFMGIVLPSREPAAQALTTIDGIKFYFLAYCRLLF